MGQYRVSTCEELGLNPVSINNNKGILAIYLDGNEDIGGLGCWVHHHPNGRDYIVTPHSWGREPAGGRMQLIKDAMEALTDSRRKYVEYGTMDQPLYYIMDDVYRGTSDGSRTQGEKFWLSKAGQCWMRSGVPTLRGETSANRKQIFAHEIGHCFVEENVPKVAYNEHDWDSWFDESVAEFLSSEVYPTNNLEHQFSQLYNYDAPFMQPYSAYVLWYYYMQKNGKGSVVRLMRELADRDGMRDRFEYLKSIGFDDLFHNFLFDFMTGGIPDSGTGNPIPRPGDVFDEVYVLDQAETEIILPEKIKNGQREFYMIDIPPGFNVTLHPPTGSSMPYYQSLITSGEAGRPGLEIKNWSSPEFIEGSCSNNKLAMIMISHLNNEILGNLNLSYELQAKTDCCSGAGEGFDGCLVGTWEMDIDTVNDLIDYEVSGTFTVTIDNEPAGHMNAEFQLRYDYDNGNYDIHKGTASACIVPKGNDGHLNRMELSGVSLGPGNIHQHYNTRRDTTTDQTEEILRMLNGFNYTSCTSEELIVMYMIPMRRVR